MMTMFALTSGILSYYYWAKCSVNLGPIAAYSFYSILTFPTIIAFDVFFVDEKLEISWNYFMGAVLIIVAFCFITLLDWWESEPDDKN
jgi:hypothetical protein